MGGSKETQTQTTQYDPAYMARINSNYDTAQGIADLPFTPYDPAKRVAGFSPLQQQGQQGLLAAANDPTSANTLNNAKGGIFSAMTGVGGLSSYQPRTITAGQLSATDLAPYMNPFQKDVIDASVAQNQYARDQQGVADNAAATAAHAFGGTRQAVQRAETTAGYDRNNQQNIAALNSQNFSQAQQAALADIGNRMSADTTNAANDLSGAGLRLNALNSQGSLATQLASISNQELEQALQRAGVIYGVGQDQTSQDQALADASYEEFLRQLQYPYEQQSLRNSALGMFPVQGTTTTQKESDPGAMGVLGGILGGAQTAASLGWKPLSDIRTKENIRTEGYDARGRRLVSWNYKWDDPSERHTGFIAQELASTDPEAVFVDPATGYFRVDYSKLKDAA
jgi:hypothetical protein